VWIERHWKRAVALQVFLFWKTALAASAIRDGLPYVAIDRRTILSSGSIVAAARAV
jgi:hypothetical protein